MKTASKKTMRLLILSGLLALISVNTPSSIGQVICVCYDSSETIADGIHFCTTPAGVHCGNNIIVDGKAVASGYKTVAGCGGHWGNPLHHGCDGLDVGACP